MAEPFNKILSRLRHEKGISQREAAAALGISQALLSHYENGVREPGLQFLNQACSYYDVSADYLLGRSACREHLDFTQDQLKLAQPYISASLDLVKTANSIDDDDAKENFASLLSAVLYAFQLFCQSDRQKQSDLDLLNALIFLRRAQLAEVFTNTLYRLPQELIDRTEDELSMLFNE